MLGILLYIIISIIMGCLSCFFGKRLYFPILMLTVFTYVLTAVFSLFGVTWKVGAVAFSIGVAAALLSVALYKLGVFLLGCILGGLLGQLLLSIFSVNVEWLYWIMILIPALLLGFCALKWCRLFIMASTAYSGAVRVILPLGFLIIHLKDLSSFIYADGIFSTMANLSDYLQGAFATQYAAPLFIVSLTMAVIGFSVQHRAETSEKR